MKPVEGKINYDEFKERKAHEFVEKVINGKVEKVELQSKKATSRSPTKVSKEQCARKSMTGSITSSIKK